MEVNKMHMVKEKRTQLQLHYKFILMKTSSVPHQVYECCKSIICIPVIQLDMLVTPQLPLHFDANEIKETKITGRGK